MAALMNPQHEFHEFREIEIEIGRVPPRPTLALVGEPRAVGRRSPRVTTRATYWRRRLVVVVMALGLLAAAGKAGAALGGTPLAIPERGPSTISYVVQPGDSLWSVAQHLDPGTDPRPLVDALAADRHGAALLPGETIEWHR